MLLESGLAGASSIHVRWTSVLGPQALIGWVFQLLLRLTQNGVLSVNVSSAISWLFCDFRVFQEMK